ncbi:MAG: DUF3786 domain-containing protein [Candidatus Methanomethylicia archaeon]|nr:DUF3786 domain-containing protein [Candidatus Methanomethylicia archaeon]MDW7988653.1 DUF3786 domain-containing protein [Nitrososphaerota archaeon]
MNWWNWKNIGTSIKTLSGRLGFGEREIDFLGLKLNLDNGEIYDEIRKRFLKNEEKVEIYYVLYMYSQTLQDVKETSEYVTLIELFKCIGDLAASHCPEFKNACRRLEEVFGKKPNLIYQASKRFKHELLDYGDASVKIYALPKVPIIITIWCGDEELPPSINIMFDKSVLNYLPDCEALVRLTKITIERLIITMEI